MTNGVSDFDTIPEAIEAFGSAHKRISTLLYSDNLV